MSRRLASALLFLLLSFGAFSQQVMSESHPHAHSARLLEQGSLADTADTPDEHLQERPERRVSLQSRPWRM